MKSILKKLAGVVMVLTLVIGMIGCANDSGSNNNSNSKSNACCGFVKVTGGTITGSTSNRCWSGSYSGVFVNNRTVKLSSFIICDHEVTKAEYKAIMDNASLNTAGITAAPSYISNKPKRYVIADGEVDEKRPVENVSWYDAVYYCNLLS